MTDSIFVVMAGAKSPGSGRGSVPDIGSGSSGAPDGRDKPGRDDEDEFGHDGEKATRS